MSEPRFRRGTGVKHTIPFVGRFSGLWFLVTTAAVFVASVSTYVIFMDRGIEGNGRFVGLLVFQTLFIVLALGGLAIFTTHRLAGPWVALQRALEDVRKGDMHRVLKIRRADAHLRLVENEFNGMMETLRKRLDEDPSE